MPAADPYAVEAWVECAFIDFFVVVRLFARWWHMGWRFKADDWWMILAAFFITLMTALRDFVTHTGTTVGLNDAQRASVHGKELDKIILGSKIYILGWTLFTSGLWCLKISMIVFFRRLVTVKWQKTLLLYSYFFCAITWVASILTILLHCRPFHKFWQVNPNPGEACTSTAANNVVVGISNIVSDFVLLAIPIALLWSVQLPLQRKLIVGALLCGGVFCIATTIVRIYFSLIDINGFVDTTIWAQREELVAAFVVNAPHIKPLVSTIWGSVQGAGLTRSQKSTNTPRGGTIGSGPVKRSWKNGRFTSTLGSLGTDSHIGTQHDRHNDSQEHMLDTLETRQKCEKNKLTIVKENDFDIVVEPQHQAQENESQRRSL